MKISIISVRRQIGYWTHLLASSPPLSALKSALSRYVKHASLQWSTPAKFGPVQKYFLVQIPPTF